MTNLRGWIAVGVLTGAFLLGLTGLSHSHDQYMSWKQPGSSMPCCNSGVDGNTGDCYPTTARFENGQWFALCREDQKWMAVPDNVVLKDGSTPDGEAHLCAPPPIFEDDNRIYCFRPPAFGS